MSDRASWSLAHPGIHLFCIGAGGLLSGFCLLFLPVQVLWTALFLGILSLAYSLPVLPFTAKKRLRDWGILKLLLLSLVWAGVTVLMPMAYWNKTFHAYEVEFLLRIMLMLPLCIAFDIRDRETDKENRIYTLPNALGLRNSFRLIHISLFTFCGLAFWQYIRYPDAGRLLGGLMIALLIRYVVSLSLRHASDIYYLLFVDGMMLVYAGLILLL